jgi:RNA polymerase sigma-70 factor (sigma-E family)
VTSNDRLRFTQYVQSTHGWLHREAYRLCRDWHEAEDLVQVTLWRVYRRWERLTEQEQLTAYTRRTLLHAYLSEHRRPRWKYEISQPQLPDTGGPAPTHAVEERVTLAAGLNRLGPRQRAVVVLRFYADLSVEQTAAAMGCSTGTVTSQTHRALNALHGTLTLSPEVQRPRQELIELGQTRCEDQLPTRRRGIQGIWAATGGTVIP